MQFYRRICEGQVDPPLLHSSTVITGTASKRRFVHARQYVFTIDFDGNAIVTLILDGNTDDLNLQSLYVHVEDWRVFFIKTEQGTDLDDIWKFFNIYGIIFPIQTHLFYPKGSFLDINPDPISYLVTTLILVYHT